MGFFENLKTKKQEKRLEQLTSDLKIIRNRNNFDPTKVIGVSSLFDTCENFTKRQQEFKILASGCREQIATYYRNYSSTCGSYNNDKADYFWCANRTKYLKVHAGIPHLTCQKMMQLGTKGGVNIEFQINTPSGEIDQEATKQANEVWANIAENTELIKAIGQMFYNDAMCGHDIVKLSFDLSASPYPIIEVFDPTNAEIIKVRNQTKAIIFKHYFDKSEGYNKRLYRLDEIYTTNELNEPIIKNKLYKLNKQGNDEQVALNEIFETADLLIETEDRELEPDGLTVTQTFKGLKGMLAFEKPNKLPNAEFPNSYYGASDIAATDISDKLDEIFSEISSEVRNNKTVSYIPDSLLDSDAEFNPFITRYQLHPSDQDQDSSNKIETDIIPDKTESHIKKAMIYLDFWCASCGLSPLSLGIATFDSVGANVSGDGLRERIKATLDTRAAKIELFKPYLQKIARQLINLNTYLIRELNTDQPQSNILELNLENSNINVNFGDYVADSESALISKLSTAKAAGLLSLETAINLLHPGWTDEAKQLEVNRLKIESNVGLESPDLLELTTPTIEETIKEPTSEEKAETEEERSEETKTEEIE